MLQLLRRSTIVVLALLALPAPGAAQNYPERVVRIVNPYPPGGSVDVMARILAQKLTDNLGQQFIVENRSGGGGNTGSESVAKSDPDGYTLLFTAPGPLTVNQTLYSKLPFDPAKDFAPIALFAVAPIVLMVHPDVPANNVQELIALAKKQPGKINFASAGIGTTNHLSGELFKSMAKIDIVHVPYRGAGPAMNDLVGGHVQMFFDLLPVSLPQINGGKVRALANAGAKRPAALASLPTIAEQGLPGFDASRGSAWWRRSIRRRRCWPSSPRRSPRRRNRPISSRASTSSAPSRAPPSARISGPSWRPRPRNGPRSSAYRAPRRIDELDVRPGHLLGALPPPLAGEGWGGGMKLHQWS